MSNPYFQFKQFTVWHDKCAMKVGTDGVLLGAWATIDMCTNVLDVGTGTGLIAMMIAQRNSNTIIDAIDIDECACGQAVGNIKASSFGDRISVIHKPFLEYKAEKKYDLIISNPPYFVNSLKSPDQKRSEARHNDSLPLKQLIEHAAAMLSENGLISLILPMQLSEDIDFIISTHRLFAVRRTEVVSIEGLQPKRFLIEISPKAPAEYRQTTGALTLETIDRRRTQQYEELMKDFYL